MTLRLSTALAITLTVALSATLSAQRITRRVFVTATAGGAPVLDLTAADFNVVENARSAK